MRGKHGLGDKGVLCWQKMDMILQFGKRGCGRCGERDKDCDVVTAEFLSLLMLLVLDQRGFLLLQLCKKIKGVGMCMRQHHLCCPFSCKGGFGEPRERILFKLTLLCPWFVLLFWFGFVPSGWFWLADFTTCSFKYKFHPWGGDRAGTRSVVIRLVRLLLLQQFRHIHQSSK